MIFPIPDHALRRHFADAGQQFPTDLSAIHLTLVEDVHFSDLEMTVHIFGRPDGEADTVVVADRVENLDEFVDLEAVQSGEPVPVAAVLALFTPAALQAILARADDIDVLWNPGCGSPAPIAVDLAHPDLSPPLLPMAQ